MYARAWLFITGLILLAALSSGCGRKKHSSSSPSHTPIAPTELGIASWYGHPYHGRQAANGEIYDMEKPTAAHRTLPFGTWVRVTNLANGKTTDVRITDRGPFIAGRIIDVSHAAAREIELIGPGIAQVRLAIISAPASAVLAAVQPPALSPIIEINMPATYAVQVGAFADRTRAEEMRTTLVRDYGAAQIVLRQGQPALWRVLVGHEESIDGANELAERLQRAIGPGFVVRLDETR